MAKRSVVVPLTPGTPVQPSTLLPNGVTMCRNIFIQPRHGSTGLLYVGGKNLNKATGVDLYAEVTPGNPTTNPGGGYFETPYENSNTIDSSSYWLDGDQSDNILFVVTTT
jgi:hypothetical protein